MEADLELLGGAVEAWAPGRVVVEAAGSELAQRVAVSLVRIPQSSVVAGARRRGLEVVLGAELIPALMREPLAGRPSLEHGLGHRPDAFVDLCLPRVGQGIVGVPRGQGTDALVEKVVQLRSERSHVARAVVHRTAGRTFAGRQIPETELLEAKHLLGERQRPKQRARPSAGRDIDFGVGRRREQQGGE